jgi:hypothetical protein
MQLVSRRNKQDSIICIRQVVQVRLLALLVRRFVFAICDKGVAAGSHNLFYANTELRPYLGKSGLSAVVLWHIVQQRCNCLVFISAGFEHQ